MPRLTVPPGSAPMRLDRMLCQQLACSRRVAKDLVANGHVRVDGRRASKGQEVVAGAVIEVDVDLDESSQLRPNPDLTIDILHEDESVVAVDKPAGLPTHPVRATETRTVANFLSARYPETTSVGKPLESGLVHRLDNDTSGVLLAARTSAAYTDLRRQFGDHRIIKKYLTLVRGDIDQAVTIDAPIDHGGGKGRRMRLAEPGVGRDAVTHCLSLQRFGTRTLLEVEIRSGVRHQIRIHLAAIGHPIDGDRLYDPDADPSVGRHLLHAASIAFLHPDGGERVIVRSELPQDFRARLAELG